MKRLLLWLSVILAAFVLGCTTGRVVEEIPAPPPAPTPPPVTAPAPVPTPPSAEAIPSIRLVELPMQLTAGADATIRWRIDAAGPLTATHTAAHFDVASHRGTFGRAIAPADAGYPFLTDRYASGQFSVPGDFSATIKVPAGATMLYLRAHAMIGGQNYWTDEMSVRVVAPETAPTIKKFLITADRFGIDRSSIMAMVGERIELRFRVSAADMSSDGYELKGAWGTSGAVMPGEETSFVFTVPGEDFEYGLYPAGSDNAIEVGVFTVTRTA